MKIKIDTYRTHNSLSAEFSIGSTKEIDGILNSIEYTVKKEKESSNGDIKGFLTIEKLDLDSKKVRFRMADLVSAIESDGDLKKAVGSIIGEWLPRYIPENVSNWGYAVVRVLKATGRRTTLAILPTTDEKVAWKLFEMWHYETFGVMPVLNGTGEYEYWISPVTITTSPCWEVED